jgi:MATE family multidrug resistance protein
MDAPAASTVSRPGAPAELIFQDLSALLRLAGPVVLSRLGIMTMGLTDTVVVGRYSAVQLGYHALGWAPTSVVLVVAVSLLGGLPVMTSRAIGEGRRQLAGAVLRRGLAYGGQIGLVSTLLLAGGGPWLMQHLGLSPGLAAGAGRVLIVFALSLTPLCLGTAASMWLEALGKPGVATVAMWLANLVNLAIDLVLVPGHFGLPALGAIGGACATLGSRTALMAALLAYIATMKEARGLGVFDKPARDRAAEAEQRKIGYGAGASGFFEVASFAGMNVIAGWIGAVAVAGYTVMMSVTSLVFMVPLGLATATSVLVGRAYGARDPRGVNRAGAVGFSVTAIFGVAISLLVWPLAGPITAAYTTDPAVLIVGEAAMALSCLFFLPDALQVVVAQSLRARGDVWVPSGTHFVSYVLVMAPLAWALAIPFGLGVDGIVWSVIASSLISASLLLGRFWMLRRAAG